MLDEPGMIPTRFIRGNHDDPAECRLSKHWIEDGTVEGNVMFIGGAHSIDWAYRTVGKTWWPDEELNRLIEVYREARPNVLITHECPEFLARNVMVPLVNGYSNIPSRTREALEAMYYIHQPKVHIFGHWHRDMDEVYDRTRFICLGELPYIDVDLEEIGRND